ncbi:acyltransferase [Mucilaginibacter corticis]|uniref:Acyltransferase n=1 Tax=Mucilaginibacter corticis TaxID=2597670 RepID=A0A556MLD9_9SPHI|nr:acyltransferase [Mucilaginibacter corticis]TSJ40740.1 acyltransferase [Mucilaginibacter corticis]
MNRKNGIDLFRLVASFFIICLHTSYGNLNKEIVDDLRLLSRWALPFFFITTGFFLGYKIENNTLDFKNIQKNVSLLISILIISSIVCLPIDIVKGNMSIGVSNILTGLHAHLWFIGSLLIGYIFIWYLFFIKRNNYLPYISIGILLLALFSDSYDQVFGKNIDFELARFLLSIPLMYIGIILAKKENVFNSISNILLIGLVIAGIAIQFIEAQLLFKYFNYDKFNHQFLLGTIIIAIPLFILSTKINTEENVLTKWGKEYSLFVYLYHPLTLAVMTVIFKFTPNSFDFIRWFSPVIAFTLTLTFSIILNKFFPKIYNIMNGNIANKTALNSLPH